MTKDSEGLSEEQFIARYDSSKYEKPSVTTDGLVFTIGDNPVGKDKALKVLLVKRKQHPFLGHWALPGGFADIDENLDKAVYRELFEETGLEDVYMEQLYTWGEVGRDPRTRVISTSYAALIDSSRVKLLAGSDAEHADWFAIKTEVSTTDKKLTNSSLLRTKLIEVTLTNGPEEAGGVIKETTRRTTNGTRYTREIVESHNLAFDHLKIIEYGLTRLRNKIEYTDIAFSLVPPLFTLPELRRVYEIILGRSIFPQAFRRLIDRFVIKTDQTRQAVGRPAALYRFNLLWDEEE